MGAGCEVRGTCRGWTGKDGQARSKHLGFGLYKEKCLDAARAQWLSLRKYMKAMQMQVRP